MARVLSSVHAISTTCSLCWTHLCAASLYNVTRPDSQFLCTRVYILCDFLWPEVQPHSDDSQMHVTAPCSAHVRTQSGSPHNVVHFLVISVHYMFFSSWKLIRCTRSFTPLSCAYFFDSIFAVTDFSFVSSVVGIPFATNPNALTVTRCESASRYVR